MAQSSSGKSFKALTAHGTVARVGCNSLIRQRLIGFDTGATVPPCSYHCLMTMCGAVESMENKSAHQRSTGDVCSMFCQTVLDICHHWLLCKSYPLYSSQATWLLKALSFEIFQELIDVNYAPQLLQVRWINSLLFLLARDKKKSNQMKNMKVFSKLIQNKGQFYF